MSQDSGETIERDVTDPEERLRAQALKSLESKRDFRSHLLAYVLVNGFFWLIWTVTTGTDSFPWPVIPMAGWAIGLCMHAWDVFGRREIGEAQVEREMQRLRRA